MYAYYTILVHFCMQIEYKHKVRACSVMVTVLLVQEGDARPLILNLSAPHLITVETTLFEGQHLQS